MNEQHLLRESGAEMIAAERERQITGESRGSAHDDQHVDGELIAAAKCYIEYAGMTWVDVPGGWVPSAWPWEAEAWKPSGDPHRDLVKAGALIAAEIDRLKRKQARWEAL